MQDDSKEKALNAFCEEVRLRGKVTCRTAIVDDDRKEFFRGKDLMRYCEANAEKLDGITSTGVPPAGCMHLLAHVPQLYQKGR